MNVASSSYSFCHYLQFVYALHFICNQARGILIMKHSCTLPFFNRKRKNAVERLLPRELPSLATLSPRSTYSLYVFVARSHRVVSVPERSSMHSFASSFQMSNEACSEEGYRLLTNPYYIASQCVHVCVSVATIICIILIRESLLTLHVHKNVKVCSPSWRIPLLFSLFMSFNRHRIVFLLFFLLHFHAKRDNSKQKVGNREFKKGSPLCVVEIMSLKRKVQTVVVHTSTNC